MHSTQRSEEAAPSTGAEVGPWERGQLTAVLKNSPVHAYKVFLRRQPWRVRSAFEGDKKF